jgi:hypothetical protein
MDGLCECDNIRVVTQSLFDKQPEARRQVPDTAQDFAPVDEVSEAADDT